MCIGHISNNHQQRRDPPAWSSS